MIEDYGNHILLGDYYSQYHGIMKENVDFETSHMYNRTKGQFLSGLRKAALQPLTLKVTEELVWEAHKVIESKNGHFPKEMFMRVVKELDGNIPLKFQMLPEGTWCPAGTPVAQVRNTVEDFGELGTWWEPLFMMASFDSACLTRSYEMYKYLRYLSERFDLPWDVIKTKFHSFGARGHRSVADGIKGALNWSTFLYGTDDMVIMSQAPSADMGSIPASGHKVTQQFDDELQGVLYGMEKVHEKGARIVAYPIDTYDPQNFIHRHMRTILHRADELNMHFVARPDSGPVFDQAIDIYNTHIKGRNRTNLSAIIGEGMDFEKAKAYDQRLIELGIPVEYLSYGIGSGFYNDLQRDTHGWAMKTAFSNKAPRMKFSADTFKRSIPGNIDVVLRNGEMTVVPEGQGEESLYETVYEYDPSKGHKEPVYTPCNSDADFVKRRDVALKQDQDGRVNQERINLDGDIISLMETFRRKYQ